MQPGQMFTPYWDSPGEFATYLRPRRQFLLSLLSVAVSFSLWLCSGPEVAKQGDAASQGCDRRPLPAPPASLWGDHIPLHPWLSPTFSYNHLPRSKRDIGCRAWEITPIERMVLNNAPSPPPSTFRAPP